MAVTLTENRRCGCVRRLLCLLLAVMFLAPCCAFAAAGENGAVLLNTSGNRNTALSVDPIRKSEGYSSVLYDNRNGLPTSEANAIAQTSDGFIWIGCYAGLIRCDGNTFERIDSTTGISNVRCLYVDSRDRLWIGTNDSGVFMSTQREIKNWNRTGGVESSSIHALAEDGEGNIYIGTTAGVAVIGAEMELKAVKDERLADKTIRELRSGADGVIYGLTTNGDLFTLEKGRMALYLSHDECRVQEIISIMPDPKRPGDLYLGTEESRVYYGSLAKNFASLGVKDIAPLKNASCFEYISGDIWICAGNGIGKLDAEGFHQLVNVPMNNSIGHMMTDYEGNLWFTSTRQGIMKIVPNQFSDLAERYDLPAAVVNTTCMYGQQLFIGYDTGLIVVENGRRVDSVPLTEAVTASGEDLGASDLLSFLDGVRIRSIIRDSRGRLWISTWRKYGLLCYDGGKLTAFSVADGLFSDQVRVASECEDGSILAVNNGGVCVIRDGRVTARYGEEEGITIRGNLTVAEGFNHEIILGSDGGGIFVIDSEGTKHIGTEDGLKSDVILRIKRSASQDLLWIVTSNSLAYMTPDLRVTTVRQFPYPNNYDLYENSNGDVWVLASSGIYVISAEKLRANGEIDPVFYGIGSGLPYIATANSYSELTEEGDLYIAGTLGVVKVNIVKPFSDISELKVSLPFIDADGTRYYPDAEGSFLLPGNVRKLTIYPYVFNYRLIDPQVRYLLEGFDLKETTVSRSKLKPVDYTNLGMGNFYFVMTVMDPVGYTEQTVTFRIMKGKEMSVGTAGTIIMTCASLLLMAGILVYTSPSRKRNRKEDRLMFGLLLTNMTLAAGELLSFVLEYTSFPMVRELMIAANTVFYAAVVFFAYLLLMYFDYCTDTDKDRVRRRKWLFGIPCFLFFAVLVINLRTGWIFSVSDENEFHSGLKGSMVYLPVLLGWLYLLFSLVRVARIHKRLAILGILLIASRMAGEIIYRQISSTSFIYTLILVCIYLYMMYQQNNEVAQ